MWRILTTGDITMTITINKTLHKLLATKRPHGTELETLWDMFIDTGIEPKVYYSHADMMFAVVDVLKADNTVAETMFTCHLDTVDRNNGINQLQYADGRLYAKDSILGADDGAGAYVLFRLITAGVPGRYVFFAGEERGGIGSRWAADNHKEVFACYKRAIAFDRKGTNHVIYEQCGGRCASKEFTAALAAKLTFAEPFIVTSGVYTDTAELTGLIPECTNVSCGYSDEHTTRESLNVVWLEKFISHLLTVDFEDLPCVRGTSQYDYDSFDEFDMAFINGDVDGYSDDAHVEDVILLMEQNSVSIADLLKYIKSYDLSNLLV